MIIAKARLRFAAALILAISSSVHAADETAVVARATQLLEQISSDPDAGIPPSVLQEAQGIAILPHIVENHIGLGRKKGRGVFLTRDAQGAWGNPQPVVIKGLSAGAEAGRMVWDIVLIYRTEAAVRDRIKEPNNLSLSAYASVSICRDDRFDDVVRDPKKETLTLIRKRGVVIGAGFAGEVKHFRVKDRVELKTTPNAGQIPATSSKNVSVEAAELPASTSRTEIAVDSPEALRLRTMLAALTKPTPSQVAGTNRKDPQITRASGTKSPAAPTAPTR